MALLGQAVKISDHHAPEPDLLVIGRKVFREDIIAYPPHAVLLAVELMSSDRRKDQVVRPEEYAEAGIPHFWRIERIGEGVFTAYTYVLDPLNEKYLSTGTHQGRLKTAEPWPLECNLRALATS
jgi:hypothetical protein